MKVEIVFSTSGLLFFPGQYCVKRGWYLKKGVGSKFHARRFFWCLRRYSSGERRFGDASQGSGHILMPFLHLLGAWRWKYVCQQVECGPFQGNIAWKYGNMWDEFVGGKLRVLHAWPRFWCLRLSFEHAVHDEVITLLMLVMCFARCILSNCKRRGQNA